MVEWKTVEGYSRYKVSTDGRVFDTETERELPQTWNGNFLCSNLIGDSGKKALCKIHRLVAIAFIENTENAHNVIHKDEDRSNNTVSNLLWKAKKVKEESVKEVKTLGFLGKEYTYPEFCILADCDLKKLRTRIKAGWSVRECFTGIKEFKGSGYSGEGMWFPNKEGLSQHLWSNELKRRELNRLQKEQEKLTRKEEKDAYKKFGVGIFENSPIVGIVDRIQTTEYKVWSGMLSRCYSPKNENFGRYGARGVRVCDEWLHYQNFAAWYREQYYEVGWHIDKDIITEGNLIYSPDTCTLVPPIINTFFATLPKGVPYIFVKGSKFVAQCNDSIGNKTYYSCDSQKSAVIAYWNCKRQAAKELADKFYGKIDMRVYFALYDLKPNPLSEECMS